MLNQHQQQFKIIFLHSKIRQQPVRKVKFFATPTKNASTELDQKDCDESTINNFARIQVSIRAQKASSRQ